MAFEITSAPIFALASAMDAYGVAEPIRAARAVMALLDAQPGADAGHEAAHNLMALQATRQNPAGMRETLADVPTERMWSLLARLARAGMTASELAALLPLNARGAA